MAKIMANYGKAFGDPAKKLAVKIALEQITGEVDIDGYTNEHMERGHEQEPIAKRLYEDETFSEVLNGGFFDCGFVGCSPDGLINARENGLIEIKSVISSTHFANIQRKGVDPAYRWQCSANLKFTEREWIDFISYCQTFPIGKRLFVWRVYAKNLKEDFEMMDARISEFEQLVYETREHILKTNYINQ